MKLNIGCGKKHLKGYVNCDREKCVKPDKIVDLEKRLPFKDNTIEEVIGNHVLACVTNFIPLMHELRRVCKDGALLKFTVPFYSSVGAFSDPLHVRFFTPFSFDYFAKNEELLYEAKSESDMFQINKVKLHFGIGSAKKFNWLLDVFLNLNHRFYCRTIASICPAAEIEFELEVIKPWTWEVQ